MNVAISLLTFQAPNTHEDADQSSNFHFGFHVTGKKAYTDLSEQGHNCVGN